MVVFTCNHCGESLQKPKVEKHYFTVCRRAKALTCVDCMKDFLNEEYAAHTKCVTEEERYAAKGAFSKPLVKKGEVKQESWTEVIQSVISENSSNVKPSQKQILTLLGNSTNVPRKKIKFTNFVKNALSRRTADVDIEDVWNLIEKYKGQQAEKVAAASENKSEEVKDKLDIENAKQETIEGSKKRKKSKNLEGIDAVEENGSNEEISKKTVDENTDAVDDIKIDESLKKKKKKKGKNGETSVTVEGQVESNSDIPLNGAAVETTDDSNNIKSTEATENNSAKKKKRKSKNLNDSVVESTNGASDAQTEMEPSKKKKKTKNGDENGETCVAGEGQVNGASVETPEIVSNNIKATEENENNSINVDGGKKKKKRKSKNLNNSVVESTNGTSEVQTETEPSKKKKKKLAENGENPESILNNNVKDSKTKEKKLKSEEESKTENGEDNVISDEQQQNSATFFYEGKILEILKTKQSMSLKKLQKKVLDAYQKVTGSEPTPKVIKKFNKHLKKINGIELSENTVTFISG